MISKYAMTLYDFMRKAKEEQLEAILKTEPLADREDKEHTIVLYRLQNCYVEVYYAKEDHSIQGIHPLRSLKELHPYFRKSRVLNLTMYVSQV